MSEIASQGESKMSALDLPTITEEDGDSSQSGSSRSPKPIENEIEKTARASPETAGDNENSESNTKDKKKKKKHKHRDSNGSAILTQEDHYDAAQQILVDLCTEMKELKTSMQQEAEVTNIAMMGSLTSNKEVMKSLSDQLAALQSNMKQLDQVIESKATPEQIEELARIRAVQEMLRVATEDKDKTVEIYETHAKRGYQEIERLRTDLTAEKKEVVALRQEIAILRAQKIEMIKNAASRGGTTGAINIKNALDGTTATTEGGSVMSDFDDEMTLNTKESYDTANYEMKSLKKRIIHMKKKLAVAQMEAEESEKLRSEVEKLRVQCDAEKKSSMAKDEKIKSLENQVQALKIELASKPSTPSTPVTTQQTTQHKHNKKPSKWWQNL